MRETQREKTLYKMNKHSSFADNAEHSYLNVRWIKKQHCAFIVNRHMYSRVHILLFRLLFFVCFVLILILCILWFITPHICNYLSAVEHCYNPPHNCNGKWKFDYCFLIPCVFNFRTFIYLCFVFAFTELIVSSNEQDFETNNSHKLLWPNW